MAEIPHFSLPFRFAGGHAAEVEQDSPDDVAARVEAVVRTPLGWRDDNPDFGIPDLTFRTQIDAETLEATVSDQVGTDLALESDFDLGELIRRVRFNVRRPNPNA